MKKQITLLTTLILMTTLASACGAPESAPQMRNETLSYNRGEGGDSVSGAQYDMAMPAEAPAMDMNYFTYAEEGETSGIMRPQYTGESGGTVTAEPVSANYAEKIIYTYHAGIETIEFDETLEKVEEMIAAHGAFIENSSVTGSSYESSRINRPRYRTAYYTIRVPVEQLNAVTGKLDGLGYVVSRSSNAENITSQFLDNESRLRSLRVQEERLLDMLSKADDVPDLITIESTLADVRYQIERITTTLNHWQHQVDFSTLTLSISEVEEYKDPPPPVNRTYWERMGDGFVSTLRSVGNFFTAMFMWLVVNAPILVILAAVLTAGVFFAGRGIRKSRAKKAQAARERAEAYQNTNAITNRQGESSNEQ